MPRTKIQSRSSLAATEPETLVLAYNPTLLRGGSGDESLRPRTMGQHLEGHPAIPSGDVGFGAFELPVRSGVHGFWLSPPLLGAFRFVSFVGLGLVARVS